MPSVEDCLRAYEESHAHHRTVSLSYNEHTFDEGRYTGTRNVSKEVDERVSCTCNLCTDTRAALGMPQPDAA